MALTDWDQTTANGKRRVFRIEINNPLGGGPIVKFHLERVFVDAYDQVLASSNAGSWTLSLEEGLADPVLAPIVTPISANLELLAQALYEKEQTALAAIFTPEPAI